MDPKKLKCTHCQGPVDYKVKSDSSWGEGETRKDVYFSCRRACDMSQRTGDCGIDPIPLPK